MITFCIALVLLVLGYLIYGKLSERVFGADPKRETPAQYMADGVDYVPMKPWRIYLIQFLNIAGVGPICGAIMGAQFGSASFLWIVFGSIFAGAVHDYMAGMISSRHGGASIAELSGTYLGKGAMWVMRVFSVILLVLCGAVFVTSPAGLLDKLTPGWMNGTFWAVVILVYYLAATLLPIDKLISKLYPVFGVLLITMAAAVVGGILFSGGKYVIPEITLQNLHPKGTPIWPYMFITVACGAISGFHATQSPMIAKCIESERVGRKVFYGAMISEAVIALVWAAAGVAFYGTTQLLSDALKNGASNVVYEISTGVLGVFGGILARLEFAVDKQALHPAVSHAARIAGQIHSFGAPTRAAQASLQGGKNVFLHLGRLVDKNKIVFLPLIAQQILFLGAISAQNERAV